LILSEADFISELNVLKAEKRFVWFSFSSDGVFCKGWAAVDEASESSLKLFTGGPIVFVMWSLFKPMKFEIVEPGDIMAAYSAEILAKGKRFWRITSQAQGAVLLLGEGTPEPQIDRVLSTSWSTTN
jgi:hypothetical protein